MIDRIIKFSLKNKLIIGILTLVLIAWGVYNFTILPIDAIPDITNNQVQVITIAPSLAPQEIEQFITYPVEIAMANIQNVVEIRSISRFGLSVVTIVFKDKVDQYLARQLVSEQITIAENNIPEGYGQPEMMPVTTGLGEIYQYVLEPEPGYEDQFTPMEIRTIQDWIVKRHLSGIPGIVEISSFGGFLKQYEVSIKPRTLVGMDLTLMEIYAALQENNQNTGGSYIEKGPYAYYIRTEGIVENKEDIEQIVIKNIQGIPILIRDIAEVKIGAPPRFGAMTKDGKGEAVGGITLMLKGANSAQVIKDVEKRIKHVEKMLPEGIKIHAYLNRAKLISKTIKTVRTNLIEGGLIVIFILILLLGNYRAGLIVASVIPLSMLFAFSMMNLFHVSANLMSLGAIDFGLIVDGSVIVVEGIIYQIHKNGLKEKINQQQMDDNIYKAGSRVSKSAVFGVLIILIVYLPILAFSGIEGKMFKPMAQTVIFALLGALLLSLTYVPVMASLFLSKNAKHGLTIADRIITFLQNAHKPVLEFSLNHKGLLLLVVVIVVSITFFLFTRMGGEFIPTLEEGDLAAQMTLPPGSSLSESVASSSRAEKILLEQFPEVKEIVSKIGTAEVPTDPMAVEDADIMIIMKPKDEWTSANTREELVDKMKAALSVLPGVSFEFTQPIQLRFNELMTGVKSDVAVKIYGEDLDVLYDKANIAASFIQNIEGAGDIRVEQIVGLPQLLVKYKRDKIAQYGLNINDINRIIRIAFAGESAGIVYEGERRFDLVVRLCEDCRNKLQSIRNLRVNKPAKDLILLQQIAEIRIQNGPMQISRDNTKRRITIGINVRNRDIESFINEVNIVLESTLILPPGYYVTYGGQFENLQAARRSSSIAVPIALFTILILLYFAFYSLKQALMIFTAIPLAAVGGIWALYLRDMPFSISAGVGFIALFGVAVLNGIVLISYYNQLKQEGVMDIYERTRIGTRARLRPVIMTASVAALGFLPMALSNAAGAEVQKPLATVVIGGLVSATFLTLIVLPIIYILFNDRKSNTMENLKKIAPLLALLFMTGSLAQGQIHDNPEILSIDRAISITLDNNLSLENAKLALEQSEKMKKTAYDIPYPQFNYEHGQMNSALIDNAYNISQSFQFPTIYTSNKKVLNENSMLQVSNLEVIRNDLVAGINAAYYNWVMVYEKREVLLKLDSIYSDFFRAANLRFELGESNEMEKVLAQAKYQEVMVLINEIEADIFIAEKKLMQIMNIDGNFIPADTVMVKLSLLPEIIDTSLIQQNPVLDYYRQSILLQDAFLKNQKNRYLPDLQIGYFNMSIDRTPGFQGWYLGVGIPVWVWSNAGRVQAAKIETLMARNAYEEQNLTLNLELEKLFHEYHKQSRSLAFYEGTALKQSNLIIKNASRSYNAGEINYIEFVQLSSEAIDIVVRYLESLDKYNQAVILIKHMTGAFRN
ncbi:MAG: CusA/CzcA family heavy metal efflux RND transporter [Bacteroidota bacterium]|nr:CusA/CzcA family heavy metal efflux RND transporter [Bacteroidota bacterium]